MPPLDFSAHGEPVEDDAETPSGPDFSGGGERVADFSSAGTKTIGKPGFLSTIGQAGLRGLKEGVSEAADVVDPFKDKPQHADTSYIGKILEQPVSEGWKDPNWWAAHIAYGGAKSAPSLAAGAAGALAGTAVAPGPGTLIGAASGFGVGSAVQALAPAYQRARQEGLDHDAAVTRAMEQAGIAGVFGAAMGAAPAVPLFGTAIKGVGEEAVRVLKKPISEALAQVFAVQPGLGAAQQVATGATEGRMPSADELGTGYAENVGLGVALTGAHAGARRLTAGEAPALAAEEHPVPAGGAQAAPEAVPDAAPRDHQVGYDLETNTFKVVGPEGETIKTGFENDAAAEAEARRMDGAKPPEPSPIDQAANEAVETTAAQAEAGNYQKGHLNLHGMDIAVETPKGATRRGIGPDGEPWENESPAHYGYLKRTEGADGEHVDTYVGPHPESDRAFVVDQIDPETGKFDEHKAILGARTIEEARDIYDRGFSDESGPARRAAIAEMPVSEFRRWLKEGDTKSDIAPQINRSESEPNAAPRDWADIAVPLAEKESGIELTPKQRETAQALVRNGMDSTEAVNKVGDIPFHENPRGRESVGEPFDKEKIYADLRQRLDQRGLKDVGLSVADVIKDGLGNNRPGVSGSWNGVKNLIQVAAGYPEHQWVLDHESVHALRGMRLFESREWKMLEGAVAKMPETMQRVEERWGDKGLTDAQKLEEGIAETFAKWQSAKMGERRAMQERTGLGGTMGRLMGKVRDLMRGLRDWWRGNNLESPQHVFDAIESGRIGRRERGAGEQGAFDTGYEPAMLNPEAPRVAEEGRNPMDATSDAIAAEVGGKGAGTYDRAMDRLRPKAGSELKNLNPVENFTIFPDTLAKTDKMFARLWNSWKDREREEHRHITGWRELIPELRNAKRGDPDVQKAYAALEMNAINGERHAPGPVRVRNVDTKYATKSKPGDNYVLTPRQEKIYHELNALHSAEWDTMMAATARKFGWKGDPSAAAISNAARTASSRSEGRQLGRLAELMHLLQQQKQKVYFPRARFGDTFISVRPKAGADKDSLGGFPELQWFETVERPWSQDVLGKSGRPDVSKRIAELQKQFPGSEIESGLLQKRPDMLRRLDIPAVEKLLMLTENRVQREAAAKMKAREGLTPDEAKADAAAEHAKFKDEMLDTLRNVMYEEMKSGFKKKARIVPGYSPDFDRSVGSHMHQMARHSADLAHREGIDRAYQDIQDKHEHESTKKWVRDWRQFQDDPTTPLGRAANGASQIGYVWTLAMNPSSTLVNLFDIPQSAIPSLAVGNGIRTSLAHMGPALAEAYRHTTLNLKQGAHIALEKIGRTPDEKAFIGRLKDDGSIHSVSVDDMRELGGRQAEAYGEIKSTFRRALDIATSNMSVMDQANRAAVALSFYRMAKDPAKLAKMAEAWKDNQKFRDAVEYNGLNPETMARFGLSEAAYEWGRANKARVMRGPLGTAMFTLHGYQTRFLSNALKLMKNMGPAGKMAAGWMMAGLWAGAGIEGLPFAQDMENLGDVVWKTLTKHDPMISYRLRDALSQAGLGKIGAEIVMKGPLSTLTGTDVSNRIGFGDVLTREWSGITSGTDVLGTVPSIMFGRLAAAWRREQTRQGHAAAAAELLPAALRNPARAAIEADQGLKTQKGKLVTPAAKIGPADLTKIGMGFRPTAQARGYEHREYGYRAKRAHGTVPHDAIPRSGE